MDNESHLTVLDTLAPLDYAESLDVACPALVGIGDRLFDRALALLMLVISAPVILGSLLLVKLTSRGPVLYSQVRLGLGGRPFRIFKIRTMHHQCERTTGPQWSTPGDPRVTSVGRFLRLTHLDELPQLWNIVRGEMSLVGPRPERPEIASQLERALPRYPERLQTLPGLTGLAQVQLAPDTGLESVRRKLACDLYYVQNRTLGLDLRILAATVTHVAGVPFCVPQRLLGIPAWESFERADAPAVEGRLAVAMTQHQSQLA